MGVAEPFTWFAPKAIFGVASGGHKKYGAISEKMTWLSL
jgi:hypothetical protein